MTDASRTPGPVSDPLTDDLIELERELDDPAGSAVGMVWWWVLLRGLLAIAFGVIALLNPTTAFFAIVIVFGAYAIVDGVMEVAHGIATRKTSKAWGWLIFAGVVSIIAGALALILPGFAGVVGALVAIWTIVAYNFVHGVMMVAAAVKSERGRGWGIAAGVISVLFSIVLALLVLMNPLGTVEALIFVVGIYAIVFGVALAVAAVAARAKGGAKAVVRAPGA